jgi:hypothetical protein
MDNNGTKGTKEGVSTWFDGEDTGKSSPKSAMRLTKINGKRIFVK